MKIKVTAKHIKKGKSISFSKCPVALALLEQTGADDVAVSGDEMWVDFKVKVKGIKQPFMLRLAAVTPAKAETFIERFDSEEKVKPFTFNITLLPYL